MPRARHAVLGLAGLLLIAASAAWAGTSNQQNPAMTFTIPGSRDVTLQACNALGCSSVKKTVTLLDPKPAVGAASFAPLLPEAGQMVRLTAAGTGKPPLAFSWQALAGTSPVSNLTGTSVWWNTAGLAAGAYTLSLQIQNGAGTATALLPVTLAQASALDFYTTTPCRLYDSRLGLVPPQSGVAVPIQASGFCGIPAGARALAANITVIAPAGGGYVTLYPGNYPQPATSTVNFAVNGTRSNNAVLPLATDGTGTLTALLAMTGTGSSADLTVDVSGYYMP